MNTYKSIYETLAGIYDRHRRDYPENGDSRQMCCMWSTNDPPDVIDGSEPFRDIEEAFGIIIDEDDALDLYDMYLEDAAKRIMAISKRD